jgi:Fe-S-cluster containining protein
MSGYIKLPIEELFKEYIDLNPFGDSDLTHYDLDLGLNRPCKFRIDEKCSIYPARPLNCRIFPYWILAEAPLARLREILAYHKCSYDIFKKKEYKKYKDILGEIILEEAKWFEMKRKVNVARLKGFDDIKEQDFRKREAAKIELIKNWNKEKPNVKQIKQLIKTYLQEIKSNTEKINKAETIIK